MNLFVLLETQEDLCTTPLLGKPLLSQVLAGIGRTDDHTVFIIHNANSDIADTLHEIDEDLYCIPVKAKGVGPQLLEAVEFAQSKELLKGTRGLVARLNYIFTSPVIPQLPESNVIVCHRESDAEVYVSIDTEGFLCVEEESYKYGTTGSMVHFINIEELKQCKGDTWAEFITGITEDVDFIAVSNENVLLIRTEKDRKQYEAYVHQFVFALDGVAVSFSTLWYNVWTSVLSEYNLQLTSDLYQTYIVGKTDEDIASSMGLPVDALQINKDKRVEEELQRGQYSFITGFQEMLSEVKRRGHMVRILSSWSPAHTEIVRKALNIPAEYIVYSIDTDIIPAVHTVLFESTYEGIKRALKIDAKWIIGCPSYHKSDDLMRTGAHLVLQTFENPVETINASMYPNTTKDTSNMTKSTGNQYTEAIQKLFPSANVQWTEGLLQGNLSVVIPVQINTSSSVGYDCVAKIAAVNSERTKIAEMLGVFDREVHFYETLAKYIGVRVPRYYGQLRSEDWRSIGILLEDVRSEHLVNLFVDTESIDVTMNVVSKLAEMHAKFWGHAEELDLQPLDLPVAILDKKWSTFVKKWESVLGTDAIQQLTKCKQEFYHTSASLQDKNQTLLHGNIKSTNLFFHAKDKTPGFLDWHFTSMGKGVQDLVFFLIESFPTQKMDLYYDLIQRYYYAKLLEYGVSSYSWEEYMEDFKAAVKYYPFFVAVWYGSLDSADLVDKNFPFFYLQRFLHFLQRTM